MENESRACPCKKLKCVRHGDCAACRLHHLEHKKTPPYCERAPKVRAPRAKGEPPKR